MTHEHDFHKYGAIVDRWFCRCGMSLDRFAGLWNADGTRHQITVVVDQGVRSGRERMTT